MKTGITVLASGSAGNALLIHSGASAIMVDAGLSRSEMLLRLKLCGIPPETIKGLLITHEHTDHVKGARILADQLGITTFTTSATCRQLIGKKLAARKIQTITPNNPFTIGIFDIIPFQVPHDAADPVGFVISVNNLKIGIATDLGHVSNGVKARLLDCDALILESNHDPKMLWDSNRRLNLKRRILGRFGHLNNNDAMDCLAELLTPRTRHLVLYHLSGECNCRDLLSQLAVAKLTELRRHDVTFNIARQDAPSETFWM